MVCYQHISNITLNRSWFSIVALSWVFKCKLLLIYFFFIYSIYDKPFRACDEYLHILDFQ